MSTRSTLGKTLLFLVAVLFYGHTGCSRMCSRHWTCADRPARDRSQPLVGTYISKHGHHLVLRPDGTCCRFVEGRLSDAAESGTWRATLDRWGEEPDPLNGELRTWTLRMDFMGVCGASPASFSTFGLAASACASVDEDGGLSNQQVRFWHGLGPPTVLFRH